MEPGILFFEKNVKRKLVLNGERWMSRLLSTLGWGQRGGFGRNSLPLLNGTKHSYVEGPETARAPPPPARRARTDGPLILGPGPGGPAGGRALAGGRLSRRGGRLRPEPGAGPAGAQGQDGDRAANRLGIARGACPSWRPLAPQILTESQDREVGGKVSPVRRPSHVRPRPPPRRPPRSTCRACRAAQPAILSPPPPAAAPGPEGPGPCSPTPAQSGGTWGQGSALLGGWPPPAPATHARTHGHTRRCVDSKPTRRSSLFPEP